MPAAVTIGHDLVTIDEDDDFGDSDRDANYATQKRNLARREGFEPPTFRFEAGFAQFQKAPEIKDFADLAHTA